MNEIRSALREGERMLVLIEADETLAWVEVPPAGQGEIRAHPLASGPEAVATLRRAAEQGSTAVLEDRQDAPALLAELSASLFPADLRSSILGARRLILVAGRFGSLPFGALSVVREGADRPLIEHGPELVLAPSASVFVDRRRRATELAADRGTALVVVGDPVFEAPAERVRAVTASSAAANPLVRSSLDAIRLYDQKLPRLEGSGLEARRIAALVEDAAGTVRTLLGPRARVSELEGALEGATHLHLATHGLLGSRSRPFDAALALSPPERLSADDLGFLTLDHLLRRWRGRLAECELVVLSACQTGVGTRLGDAEISLPWGFFYAGAPAVIVSLWKVDDAATTLVMERFYENLLGRHEETRTVGGRGYEPYERIPKTASLREAQAWLRARSPEDNRRLLAELGFPGVSRSADEDAGIPGPSHAPQALPEVSRFDFSAPRHWAAFVLIGAPD